MNSVLSLLSPERVAAGYASGFWRRDTLYTLVREHALRAPQAIAVRDRFRSTSYRQLIAAADRLALDLHLRGVGRGQRVAIWLPSRLETAVGLLACSRNGYVCCPSLHRDHTTHEVLRLLERIGASALIWQRGYGADAQRFDLLSEARGLASLQHIYVLPALNEDSTDSPLFETVERAPTHARAPGSHDEPDRVVYLAFTSGTTSEPKGVMHSDNTLLANARALTTDWELGECSVTYSLSPLSHNLGIGSLIGALAVGGQLVVHDLPRGERLFERLNNTRTTFLVGVPTHAYDLLQEMEGASDRRLPELTGFRISGAAVSRSVVEGLMRHGIKPQSGYGMTESSSNNYTLPDDDAGRIVETSGPSAPGYDIRIFRRDDRDVAAQIGEVGQIGGRGASLMLGYFDDQVATESAFNADGWFMTGDLGWMDSDGYLRVTGREKELIIRGGHNIFPARIESLAMRHPAVTRAAAVPVSDVRLGEKVCLAVTLSTPGQVDAQTLLQHLDEVGLSRYDMPEHFVELPEIPLTASGKILKREIVDWLREGRFTPLPVRFVAKETL